MHLDARIRVMAAILVTTPVGLGVATGWRSPWLFVPLVAATLLGLAALERRATRELRRQLVQADGMHGHLAAIVNSTQDAIFSSDLKGTVHSWNSGAAKIFGYTAAELVGQPVDRLVPPDDLESERAILARVVRGEEVDAHESRRLHKDGTAIPVSLAMSPIRDRSGVVVGVAVVGSDLTGRQQAERRFELIVESAPNAVIVVDARGRIILVNSQAEKMFGWDRADLLEQSMEVLVPERFRAAHPGLRADYNAAPSSRPMGAGRELFGLRRDGSEVPIEIGLNPVDTREGRLVLASIIDITERRQAARRIEDSLREKEVLLKEIHHRVKNNLAVIGSLLYLQSTTVKDEATLRILRDCRDRVRSMALVHERLYRSEDLAGVDFGEYAAELAREMLLNSAPTGGRVGLRLDCARTSLQIDQAIPCGLILTELLTNALKHAFPDGRQGTIHVSLSRIADGRLVLSVRDDGVGLPPPQVGMPEKSLGMRLIRSLAAQLDAELEFRDGDPGTVARLTLGGVTC